MDSSTTRLIAALLSQSPGSQVVDQTPGGTQLALSVPGQPQLVVVLEAIGGLTELDARVKHVVDGAKTGMTLTVVVVNPQGLDVASVLQAHIRPMALQLKPIAAVSWVPGQRPVAVRNHLSPHIAEAVMLANSSATLSLEEARASSELEAERIGEFQGALMQRTPLISWALTLVCVLTFGLQMFWGGGEPILSAARMGAEIPNRVFAGEWWRMFSVMLLHANLFHLAMNLMAMLSFGPFLERLIGSGRYLVLFVLAGLGGSLLSLTRGGDGIGVGASGGIWGLMVAGAVVVTWPRGLMPSSLALQLRQRAWVPVAINLVYSLQPGIDMLAHVGGGIAGGLLVLLLSRGGTTSTLLKPSWRWNVVSVAVGALLVGSMGIALTQGKPWDLIGPWRLEPTALEGTGLTISVPDSFELKHEPGSRRWHWGGINETGADLFVDVSEQLDEGEDLSGVLDALVQDPPQAPEALRYSKVAQRLTLPSGQPVVFAELTPINRDDERFLWEWWSVRTRRWVTVVANALNSTSKERRAQLGQIADSVQ